MNSSCPFCSPPREEMVHSDGVWYARFDRYPVTPGHLLVLPLAHRTSLSEISDVERQTLLPFLDQCRELLDSRFHAPGYNIGVNIGPAAGQTIPHLHIHVIPRYNDDCPDPRGGIRAVIPKRQHQPSQNLLSLITGLPDPTCTDDSFADLADDNHPVRIASLNTPHHSVITDTRGVVLASAFQDGSGWKIANHVFGRMEKGNGPVSPAGSATLCVTTRDAWIAALKEYYSSRIIQTTTPIPEMSQAGREEVLLGILENVWGSFRGSSCIDCCCGSGTGSAVIRELGMKPVSYDNMPNQLALGFLRGRLRVEETCCIDGTIATRYIDPVKRGIGLMLGDINGTNAGIWERVVSELLALTGETLITTVTEREICRVSRWCREQGREAEVFENTRHPVFDRWVCTARPRR